MGSDHSDKTLYRETSDIEENKTDREQRNDDQKMNKIIQMKIHF